MTHPINILEIEITNLKMFITHYEETAVACRKRADDSDAKRGEAIDKIAELEAAIAALK